MILDITLKENHYFLFSKLILIAIDVNAFRINIKNHEEIKIVIGESRILRNTETIKFKFKFLYIILMLKTFLCSRINY